MKTMICRVCGRRYSLSEGLWRCVCGGLSDIDGVSEFPLEEIGRRRACIWRYREALPLDDDRNIVSFNEGYTPLVSVAVSGREIFFKMDHLFPSGSFKDRGASVMISKVKELGIKKVIEDSSGNAGSAIAAYCSAAGIECDIYLPADTAAAKLVQIEAYGARAIRIPGDREDTAAAVLKAAEKEYYAGHSWNPLFLQGTKTFAFEVCEQLDWTAPDTVVLPAGNGTLVLGAYTGFSELKKAGIIDKMPRIIAVQAHNCPPLYIAYKNDAGSIPSISKRHTAAEGIAVAEPVRGSQILETVRSAGGAVFAVTEREITEMLFELSRKGFYIEPTSAVAPAGVKKYLNNTLEKKEIIVSAFTGHGLKATDKIMKLKG